MFYCTGDWGGNQSPTKLVKEVNPDDAFSFLDRDVPDDIVYLLIE